MYFRVFSDPSCVINFSSLALPKMDLVAQIRKLVYTENVMRFGHSGRELQRFENFIFTIQGVSKRTQWKFNRLSCIINVYICDLYGIFFQLQ
jgi:hypothetical protein